MRIAVVGTSNSVMKRGYTLPLKVSPQEICFANFSIGMSAGCMFPITATGVDFSDFDFCILDFCVNEEIFVQFGMSIESIKDYVNAWSVHIYKQGCVPIIMMLPRNSRPSNISYVYEAYIDIARSLNIPYFDAIYKTEYLTAKNDINRNDLFKDDGHLKEWFAIALGNELLSALRNMHRSTSAGYDAIWEAPKFRRVSSSTVSSSIPTIRRANSLVTLEFKSVAHGNNISYDLDGGEMITAVCINLGKTSGVLTVRGEEEALFDLRNDAFEPERDSFMMAVFPLQTPVRERDGHVSLAIRKASDISPPNKVRQIFPASRQEQQQEAAALEVSHIVVRSLERNVLNRRPAPRLHFDLAAQDDSASQTAIDLFKVGFLS